MRLRQSHMDSNPSIRILDLAGIMHILNRRKQAINGARILMLGVAYKQDIDDYRESPAIQVYRELKEVGALVDYYDPWVP